MRKCNVAIEDNCMMINQVDSDLFEEILASVSNGIYAVDCQGQIIYWGNAMEQLSGLRRCDVLNKNIYDVFPLLKNSEDNDYLIQAFDGVKSTSQNNCYMKSSGEKNNFFKTYYAPLRAKTDEIIGSIVIVHDLSELQEANQKIQETEDRFRIMSDCAPIAIWMSREDTLCDFFNNEWLKFTGRTFKQEFGVGWAAGIHPEDYQYTMDSYLAAFHLRENFTIEYRLKRHDGQFRWLLDCGTPRYTPEGKFVGYIGSCTDITDIKTAIGQLDDVVKQLEKSLQVRDDFLSIAAHELRTPMTPLKINLQAIQLYLPTIIERCPDAAIMASGIENIQRQVDRMLKLIENLLDASNISRIEKQRLNIEEVDLVQIVNEVLKRYQRQNIHLNFSCKQCIGHWDVIMIDQIVDNVFNNAIKYGKNNPITIYLTETKTHVKLIIQDEGIGISKKSQKIVFNRFERAAPSEHYGGLGLGLYIVKQYVSMHDGTIIIKSEVDKGTSVIIELPKKPEANKV